jgi:hypothetical protein
MSNTSNVKPYQFVDDADDAEGDDTKTKESGLIVVLGAGNLCFFCFCETVFVTQKQAGQYTILLF